MSIFKKIFRKKGNSEADIEINKAGFKAILKKEFSSFSDLVDQNAGLSFEKQITFNELTGANSWNINLNEAKISFGDKDFPIEVIGSLSFNDYSWMWGWANSKSGIPENTLKSSLKIKEIGENKQIEEFTNAHFSVEEGFEHKMGMVAVGVLNADAYFCANYGQGTMVLAITSDDIPKLQQDKIEKVLTIFPQLIGVVDLNHKEAFLNYLIDRDFKIKPVNNQIEGLKNDKSITAEFDELSRLKSINGEL